MKQILFTLLFFCVAGLISCRKSNNDVDIKTYDQQQIQSYISANGLTGFSRDLSGGDTTGIYYKILTQGKGSTLDYPSLVSLAFTVSAFDGGFVTTDTIANHVYNYLGHITSNQLPKGVELAILNILKTKGTRARVLIPSHLGYGTSGFAFGGGSANRINGNQCIDYYINVIDNDLLIDPKTGKTLIDPVTGLKTTRTGQDVYDDISVTNYITANNLTGFTKTASGLYYKVTQTAAGAVPISTSIITVQYTGTLFNGLVTSETYNNTDGSGLTVDLANDTRKGLVEGLKLVPPGSKITLIMPSRLAFGNNIAGTSGEIPAFSCFRYDISIISVQ